METDAFDVHGRRKTTTEDDINLLLGRSPEPLSPVTEEGDLEKDVEAPGSATEPEQVTSAPTLPGRTSSYSDAVGTPAPPTVTASEPSVHPVSKAVSEDKPGFWDNLSGYNRVRRNKVLVHPINRGLCGPLTFYERISFNWVSPLLKRAQTTVLGPEDMCPLPVNDEPEYLTDQLEAEWAAEQEAKGDKANIAWAYYRTFHDRFWKVCMWHALEAAFLIVQSWLLGKLILSIDDESDAEIVYGYAIGLVISFFITACVVHHFAFMEAWRFGQVCMAATLGAVYRKSLRLRQQDMVDITSGFILNLITNDAERFLQACIFGPFVVIGPTILTVATLLVWEVVGWPAFCGMAFLLITIPIYLLISRKLKDIRNKIAVITDRRVKTMSEVLGGMRVLKMNGWIAPFRRLLREIRAEEIGWLRQVAYIKGFQFGLNFATPTILAASVFIPYVLATDGELTERVVFTTMALFNAVRFIVGMCVPFSLQSIAEMRVVFGRINRMMAMKESGSSTLLHQDKKSGLQRPVSEASIKFDQATLAWAADSDPILIDATFELAQGELIMVVGPVGSGKSGMVMAMLEELVPRSGTVEVNGTIAYAPQEAWILSDTVRENILFGEPFHPVQYDAVVKACQLERDFEIFERGDLTFVGERGVTLSGGQRARIGLARAVYSGRDLFLLDDPLSAVDAKVGAKIFDECINGPLLAGKTRVLVTHQLQFASRADRILVIGKTHKIEAFGTYEELDRQGIDFTGIVLAGDDAGSPGSPVLSRTQSNIEKPASSPPIPSVKRTTTAQTSAPKEARTTGVVTRQTYLEYARAGCGTVAAAGVLMILMVVAQVADIMTNWWLTEWAAMSKEEQEGDEPLHIYGGLLATTTVLSFVRCFVFMYGAIMAARVLHDSGLASVLGSPILYFDTTPVGTILNKFSKDLGYVDDLLPMTAFDFLAGAITVIAIVLLSSILNPFIFLVSTPLTIIFFYLRKYYLKASREIKRVEAIQRSPKYGLVSSSLVGLPTIRSRGASERFASTMSDLQDAHGRAYLSFILTSRWLGFRLDVISTTFVTAVTLVGVALRDDLGSGTVGLSLIYCFTLSGLFQWIVRQSAEVENQMISVERITQLNKLDEEVDNGQEPPSDWPKSGRIEFKNVTMRYAEDGPQVLKGLTFSINHAEKIGIVGRTGAGKSSLMEILFRLSPHEGSIFLDGLDTNEISLDCLRSAVSVIPQEPLLFSGSIRFNIDPFNDFGDDRIWDALGDVQLKSQLPHGLETVVAENGSNFSVGQRQLICLARALLKSNRFLILDEATANIDPATDAIIQKVIRERFQDWTVLTIAHRLNTVIDSDRILVLDDGRVAEFGQPSTLRRRKGSLFAELASHSERKPQNPAEMQ